MKRLVCILLTALLLGGCTLPRPTAPTYPPVSSPTDTVPVHEDAWAYAQLSAEQKENYEAVYTAIIQGFDTDNTVTVSENKSPTNGISVPLPHPLVTEKALSELYDAVMQDNPSFFHIGGVYGYTGRQYGEERRFTALTLTYILSAKQRAEAQTALENKVTELLSAVSDTASAYEKELQLHDALCAACVYDSVAAQSTTPLTEYPSAFTVYGALVEGKAVCEGYARAMQYLLQRADIPSTVVSGKDADGHAHMWNAVRLEGELYYLDATWNDNHEVVTYGYFNLNTEELLRSHQPDDSTLGLEITTATAQNYHRRNDTYLDTLRLEEVASVVAERLAGGEETVHLRFTETAYTNALLFINSASWFTETVNAYLPESAEPITTFTVICDEKQRTVTICKKTS